MNDGIKLVLAVLSLSLILAFAFITASAVFGEALLARWLGVALLMCVVILVKNDKS